MDAETLFLSGLEHVAPLQSGARTAGDVRGVTLLVDRFLLDHAKRINLSETFVDGVLEETDADGEDLGYRVLGHPVRTAAGILASGNAPRTVALGHE